MRQALSVVFLRRSARLVRTAWKSGDSLLNSCSKKIGSMIPTVVSPMAVAVAVRGVLVINPSSPIISPGFSTTITTFSPPIFLEISTAPDSMT